MEPLRNNEIQGNEELLTESYDLYDEEKSDEVDAVVRVFQRFLNLPAPIISYPIAVKLYLLRTSLLFRRRLQLA